MGSIYQKTKVEHRTTRVIMKEVTRIMINEYKIKQLGYDFMGYSLQKGDIYTYHHMIVPKRHHGPMTVGNGAILCGKSSHPYIHTLENWDMDMFVAVTKELIEENRDGRLTVEHLRKIRDILLCFEREYSGKYTRKGKPIIKEEFVQNRIKL